MLPVQQPQAEKNVLYFSDLPTNLIQTDLDMFLSNYKENIVVINLEQKQKNLELRKPLSAKVIFKNYESANKCRLEMNLKKIKGRAVRIMWDERDNSIRFNTKNNLFIKNIPKETTPRQVYEFFMTFGDISSLKVNEDESGNHLGYGYLTYYNADDAEKAIAEASKKNVWGTKLEVTHFQKKNERAMGYMPQKQRLYINNFPQNYTEQELNKVCQKYGEIESCKIFQDTYGRKYAILEYKDEQCTRNALTGLATVVIGSNKLLVEVLQSKGERKMILENKIRESNSRLNEQYRNCNLHIRNIPFTATEDDLRNAFSKFGPIKSLKIETYILETKEKDTYKEIPTSKGFGYICYETPEAAKAAIDGYNGKYLPNFESWNRPLLIDYFMPKYQRQIMTNQFSMGMNPGMMYYPPQGMMPPNMMYPMPYQQRPRWNKHYNNQRPNIPKKPARTIDMAHFNSLDEDGKRDYLGEQIFKAIEESPIAVKNNMTIDTIGKITGMIINIPDMNEVIEILKNDNTLNMRINEGLELIKGEQ